MKKQFPPTPSLSRRRIRFPAISEAKQPFLELKSGTYFGLDEVGATIWNLIAQPRRVIEIRDALLSEYDVDAERCGRELIELLDTLERFWRNPQHRMTQRDLIAIKAADPVGTAMRHRKEHRFEAVANAGA